MGKIINLLTRAVRTSCPNENELVIRQRELLILDEIHLQSDLRPKLAFRCDEDRRIAAVALFDLKKSLPVGGYSLARTEFDKLDRFIQSPNKGSRQARAASRLPDRTHCREVRHQHAGTRGRIVGDARRCGDGVLAVASAHRRGFLI